MSARVRRTETNVVDMFGPDDFRAIVGVVDGDEWEQIRRRWRRYYYLNHRRALGEFARGEIDADTLYDRLEADRRAAKKPKIPGGLATSGQRKLLKLAARALFIRECRSVREMDARAAVIAALSAWAAPSTIYAFLPRDAAQP